MNKASGSQSAGVRRKAQIKDFLKNRNSHAVTEWARNNNSSLRTLASLLFDPDPLMQWRAIEAMGLLAADIAQNDKEPVRRQIRRLFWLMNDESGGLCWNAPEAIAEIIVNIPGLANEYVPNLFSFMDEEPFEAGVRWAVFRLINGQVDPGFVADHAMKHFEKLEKSLVHDNPRIRAFGVLALKALGHELNADSLIRLSKDDVPVTFYDIHSGTLKIKAVKDFLGL